MTYWDINKKILCAQYPGLLEEITKERDIDQNQLTAENTVSGNITLKCKGIYIHSNRDPKREAERLAEISCNETARNESANSKCPIIIPGFGLGYMAEAVKKLNPERPLIIIEKYRSILRFAMEQRDLSSLLRMPNIVFICGTNSSAINTALSLFEEPGNERKTPLIMRNRALCGLDAEWYEIAENRIRTWGMRDDVNTATSKRFGKRWVKNLARNLSYIKDKPGINRLAGLAEKDALPVFLAAAGPGLDQCTPYLKEIRERCIIVAVDTSLRFLLHNNINPDFAVVVDPQFWNSKHLDRLLTEKICLIAESAVYPPVLRLRFREIFLCSSLFPLGTFIENQVDPKGELGAGGSVATTAWDFCRILGAKQIFIAGLDLAYPELKTHYRGAAFEEKSNTESFRLNPGETWLLRSLRDAQPFMAKGANNPVLTDKRLSLYAAWFENRFSQYKDIRNLSISSGGLAIAGLENVSVNEILALPKQRKNINNSIENAIKGINSGFYAEENVKKRDLSFDTAVSRLKQGLSQIKTAAEKGLEICKSALKNTLNETEKKKILEKLDKINRDISESSVKEIASFLFPPPEKADENSKTSDPFQNYLETSAKLYLSLAESAEFYLTNVEISG